MFYHFVPTFQEYDGIFVLVVVFSQLKFDFLISHF